MLRAHPAPDRAFLFRRPSHPVRIWFLSESPGRNHSLRTCGHHRIRRYHRIPDCRSFRLRFRSLQTTSFASDIPQPCDFWP